MGIYDAFDDIIRWHCASCDIWIGEAKDYQKWGVETQLGVSPTRSEKSRTDYEEEFAEFSRRKYGIDPESESETISDR